MGLPVATEELLFRTMSQKTPFRQRYDDACAAAHALDLVGDRWALLVIRELMSGPKRFTDLRRELPGLSANVLTRRLEELEARGVLLRDTLPPPAASRVYVLTEWGRAAEPIFVALGRWGVMSPLHDPTRTFSPASLMLSLRTMAPARIDPALSVDVVLAASPERLRLQVAGGDLSVRPDDGGAAAAEIAGPAAALAQAIYGLRRLRDLEDDGVLTVGGDRGAVAGLLALYAAALEDAGAGRAGQGPPAASGVRRDQA